MAGMMTKRLNVYTVSNVEKKSKPRHPIPYGSRSNRLISLMTRDRTSYLFVLSTPKNYANVGSYPDTRSKFRYPLL